MKEGGPVGILDVHIRPRLDKQLYNRQVSSLDRMEQRGATRCALGLQLCLVFQQHLDGLETALVTGVVQGCAAILVDHVDCRPLGEQQGYGGHIGAVVSCKEERSALEVVPRCDIRASLQQQPQGVAVACLRGLMQWC